MIVLDRIIYLCSFATGKVIFYLFNLVLFTYSITKYAWDMDPLHRYSGRLAIRAIYFTKAISLVLQAMQIHFGIPHKSTLYRQFLTSSVSRVYVLGFRLYRAIPFLYELRCVLDWSCTTTSLTMYDWLKVCMCSTVSIFFFYDNFLLMLLLVYYELCRSHINIELLVLLFLNSWGRTFGHRMKIWKISF